MNQRDKAIEFAADWKRQCDEDSDAQTFWNDLLREIFGIDKPRNFIEFEKRVSFEGHTHKIDAYIQSTKVLIEQKSSDKSLSEKYLQSDKKYLTPLEQAFRYAENMNFGERPRWIVTCNFSEFRIYYTQKFFFYYEIAEPVIIKLENLPDEYNRLKFLVDPEDTTILENVNFSKMALLKIDKIRDDFKKRYTENPVDGWDEFLYKICTRLVFCFFADDLHLFNEDNEEKIFSNYLQHFNGKAQIDALENIFDVLATPVHLRGNLDTDLQRFPYVNGKLFDEKLILPDYKGFHTTPLDEAIRSKQFQAEEKFHWEKISPPIFGALFEDDLKPEPRRSGGMHYTSVENIHKVIDPLFLDDLQAEFKAVKRVRKNKLAKLKEFQNKLASLTFLDPACGSGNFLTETFLSIRGLENETIREMYKIDKNLFDENPVKVRIENFFGIEIHAYAVAVAQIAMWIANLQMLRKTENILSKKLKPFPLRNIPQITCANALQIDWNSVVGKDNLNYIIGNPPFVGGMMMTHAQKADMIDIWSNVKGVGEMDYVSAWYRKAVNFIKDTKIECAFVSTNSITQGQQALTVWKHLIDAGVKINFAYKTFKWSSESIKMAAVHCVIIGFAMHSRRKKVIYDGEKDISAKNINAYLIDAPDVLIDYRSKPLCNVPSMHFGNMPRDGGHLIINPDDIDLFKKNIPEKFIRPYIGAEEFINGKKRWCLWLKDFEPEEFMKYPLIAEKVNAVKDFRLNSKATATRKFADTPHLFCQIMQSSTNYILIPRVSSENRSYIPIGFLTPDVIASDAVHIIPNAGLYEFGVLISSVHMAWTRAVCGRLEMRYRYSKDIVYNNFVWCNASDAQKKLIETTAQGILDVLEKYSSRTLGNLYDEKTMPDDLRAAHKANDYAVASAYGFENILDDEPAIVAALMKKYKSLAEVNRSNPPCVEFLPSEMKVRDVLRIIFGTRYYYFGVLTSSVHMAWMRTVAGRLKSDYRYSKDIVYNNFIWCRPTIAQKNLIELTAQKILEVRAEFEGKTLAYLYGKDMPDKLREAHAANDAAVMAAYGFDENMTEFEMVSALMKMYQALTK